MIRVYDRLGRIKEEIDTRSEYYLHVSYVNEHGFGWEETDDPNADLRAVLSEVERQHQEQTS